MMRKTTQLLTALLVLMALAATGSVYAEGGRMGPPPGLIILPARSPESARFQAEQLRQLLTVRLVNRGMYRVVSNLAVEAVLRERELSFAEIDQPEVRTAVAEALDADYILETGFGTGESGGTWNLILTNAYTHQSVWSTIVPVSVARPNQTVRTVTDRLTVFGRDLRMVQLSDVRILLEAGEVDRAETLYQRYVETNPSTPATLALGTEIDQRRAEAYYTEAQRYTELQLFDRALVAINRAIALRPEDERYNRYIEEIRAQRRLAEDAARTDRLKAIEALVNEGYYTSADVLLAELEESDGNDPQSDALRARIETAVGARDRYEAALDAYWSGEYATARRHITEAIRRVPERPEYGRLLAQIDRADGNREYSAATWEGYRNRLAEVNVGGMIAGPVAVRPAWEIAVGGGTYTHRDRETLDETAVDQTRLAATYRRPYLLTIGSETPVFSLYAGWHVGVAGAIGSDERDGASGLGDGTRTLNRHTYTTVGPTVGGFLLTRLFGFSLSGGMEVDGHALIINRLERDPATDTDRYTTRAAWVPMLNWFADWSWHWNEENRITVRFTRGIYSTVVPAIDSGEERYRTGSFMVAYGRSIR